MIIFDYIYYRTYCIYKYKWKDDDSKIYSITLVTLLQSLNLISALFMYIYINSEKLKLETSYTIILFFIVLALNFLRYRDNKNGFSKLSDKWNIEAKRKRVVKGCIIIFYILISIGVFIKLAFLSSKGF